MLEAWLQAISSLALPALLRDSAVAYLLVNAAHILAIGLLFGSVAVLDLRLLGLFGRQPVASLAAVLARVAVVGLALALVTGLLLASVRPVAYLHNPAFQIKMALVAAGAANALWLVCSVAWRATLADGRVRPAARLAGALSLSGWIGAVVAGRWIGFLA